MARTLSVRTATTDDLPALIDFARATLAPIGRQSGPVAIAAEPERLATRLAAAINADRHEVLIACDSGRVVGAAALSSHAPGPWADAPTLEVHALLVGEEDRRRGVARTLLGEVMARAEAIAADDIVVSAPPGMREAHRFYARLGFAPVATRRVQTVSALRRRMLPGTAGGRLLEVRLRGRRRSAALAADSADAPGHRTGLATGYAGNLVDGQAEVVDLTSLRRPTPRLRRTAAR